MSSPRYWREIPHRYRLEAGKCSKCGKGFFPKRLVCDDCKGREFETMTLSGRGELLTFTIIRVPPSQFKDQAPYALGIVELDEGVRLTGQIADVPVDNIEIGQKMKIEFRKIQEEGHAGILAYGYKFVPAL
jgi:uncharacterized OB-fold protein